MTNVEFSISNEDNTSRCSRGWRVARGCPRPQIWKKDYSIYREWQKYLQLFKKKAENIYC